MFADIERPQQHGIHIEGRPVEYYDTSLGITGDVSGSPSPLTETGSEIIQATLVPVVEAVMPLAKKVVTLFSSEQVVEEPKSVISEFDPEIGENIEIPIDEMKPVAKPKDDPDKYTPPYEGFCYGTAQALVNWSVDDNERPASNDVIGPVVKVLLDNHGSAPIELIARKTGQSKEFIRGHGRILSGVFKHSIDPNTNQEILSAPPLANQTYATNEAGWTIVIPMSENDMSTAD